MDQLGQHILGARALAPANGERKTLEKFLAQRRPVRGRRLGLWPGNRSTVGAMLVMRKRASRQARAQRESWNACMWLRSRSGRVAGASMWTGIRSNARSQGGYEGVPALRQLLPRRARARQGSARLRAKRAHFGATRKIPPSCALSAASLRYLRPPTGIPSDDAAGVYHMVRDIASSIKVCQDKPPPARRYAYFRRPS